MYNQKYTGKALIIPLNLKREILIQDRRGFKKPDWWFFWWGIEDGETPLQAVIRETKEELDIDIEPNELVSLWEIGMQWNDDKIPRYFFLYFTDQDTFTVLEWAGAEWMSFEKAREKMLKTEPLDILESKISELNV